MTIKEINDFRDYIENLDASFDEFKMLISIIVNEAAEEYMHTKLMEEIQ